jgi:uncharacterized protein YkwD
MAACRRYADHLTRSRLRVVAVTLSLGMLAAACMPSSNATPVATPGGSVGAIVAAVNHDRGANGLPPVAWNQQLGDLAQHWANVMAFTGQLTHQDLGSILRGPSFAGWHVLAENILVAPATDGPAQLESIWMASPPHRSNILNGGLTRIGVGLTVDGQGRVWAVEDFGA